MRKPAFSNAATAFRWLTPGSFGMRSGYGDFDHPSVFVAGRFLGRFNILADRDADIGERFFLRSSLRPASREPGTGNAKAFFRFVEYYTISCHANVCYTCSDRSHFLNTLAG